MALQEVQSIENKRKFHLILVAAGMGTRTGNDTPKQYLTIGVKSLLRITLERFITHHALASVSVVIHPDFEAKAKECLEGLPVTQYVKGGETRQQSVFKGLKSLEAAPDEIILIHDAARPFVSPKDIDKLLEAMDTHKAASLASPVSDTLRKANDDNFGDIVSRDGLWALQTPQACRYSDIMKAHEMSTNKATDDSSLLSDSGVPVHIIQGSRNNIKITTAEDFKLAEKLLSPKTQTRIGNGFDVHAFDFEKPGPVRIGGIDIPHDHKLKGHSDADVLLHAITDALLGTISAGDIGTHFPPSNPEFKNMDSAVFLEDAAHKLTEQNGTIINIDATIICEEPKIGPHRPAIQARIAQILNIVPEKISIKATTSEGLGFTGRKEGIAVQAFCSVEFPA